MEATFSAMLKFDPTLEAPLPISSPRAIGANVTRRTLFTYVKIGLRNRHTGKRVILESAYVCHQLCTSREAWARFLRRLNETG
ncbi:MAG: hypothetical protein U0836_16345 [Pirellulales bacterium]